VAKSGIGAAKLGIGVANGCSYSKLGTNVAKLLMSVATQI
jgi:hypothetical protein